MGERAISKTKIKKSGEKAMIAGGSATGGGINFQAAVTAVAEVHVAVGAKLDWLVGIAHDVPISVLAETGGPGDDFAIQFNDGTRAEVQVKRGLAAGKKMWEAVMKLAKAVNDGTVDYGVLVVCPNSSGTIRNELARDLERLAGGRSDGLKKITNTFVTKLGGAGLSVDKVSKRFRIITLSCLINDSDAIRAAKAWLGSICESADGADRAWNALYLDGARLIEFRGARAADSVVQVLRSEGLALKTDGKSPSLLLDSLCQWTVRTTSNFSIPGISQPLPIDEAWIRLDALVLSEERKTPISLAEALEHYHSRSQGERRRDGNIVKGETLGRFVRRCVLIGGPGMGKSTLLKKLARVYAMEAFPVLLFSAKILAKRIQTTGCSFEEGIVALGTDGFGLPLTKQVLSSASQWIVLCDALDEAENAQEIVCDGLLKFSAGHPMSRIVVTTRPIGYSSALLRAWRHYELQPLDSNDVERHAERLVRVAITNPDEQEKAVSFSKVQFDRNKNARIAARSPLILGLISALAIQGVPFGDTKVQLYERLFSQMESAQDHFSLDGGLSSSILAAYLDILAWEILHNPTATVSSLNVQCGAYLAEALSEPLLKARAMAEKCFSHWERVGMVEKVSHAGTEVATFIHKTFSEYAAARHLSKMPKDAARGAINEHIDDKAWSEVLMFTSSLGLADIVLEESIGTSESLAYETVAEALTMMAVSEAKPSMALRTIIFEAASRYLGSPISREAISTGKRLVNLAGKFPQEVFDVGASFADSDQPCTRLAARALMTFGGIESHDNSELRRFVSELPDLVKEVSAKTDRQGIFDFDAYPSKLIEVVYAFAFHETLKRMPHEEASDLLHPLLAQKYNGTVGGYTELLKILEEHNRPDLTELLARSMKDMWSMPEGFFTTPSDFLTLFFQALMVQLPSTDSGESLSENAILWQLSGFMAATGYMQQPVGETWPEKVNPEDTAIQEVLRGCLISSGVEPATLGKEIISILKAQAQINDRFSMFVFEHIQDLDNEMEWDRAKGMDLQKLESALHYSSAWVVQSAANLIAVNTDQEGLAAIVKRVFNVGRGNTLWAVSQLCLQLLQEPMKSELFFDRLEKPLVAGCQHLYSALAHVPLPLNERLLNILRNALVIYNGPRTAIAAAQVAERYVIESGEIGALLQESFDLWFGKEEPYPVGGGTIPPSPREQILKLLLMRSDFDKHQLLRYSSDARGDVSRVASDALLQALTTGELRDEFLEGLDNGGMSPNLLTSALKQKVVFTESQLQIICGFIYRSSTELQKAAIAVLQNGYMSTDEIRKYAKALETDPDPEIREHARRLL